LYGDFYSFQIKEEEEKEEEAITLLQKNKMSSH